VESAERTFTVEADVDAPVFTNGPYAIQPGGTFKDIILSLRTGSGAPVPNADITLVLPAGFIYADGSGGSRIFRTGTDGLVTISGVKGPGAPGGHDMTATYRNKTATARLVIVGVVSTISGIRRPEMLSSSPNGSYVYVGTYYTYVSVLDPANLTVIETINVGANVRGVACSLDGAYVYVANDTTKTITVINASTFTKIKTISSPNASWRVTCSVDGERIYVSDLSQSVSVISTANGALLKNIIVPGAEEIVCPPNSRYAFVANNRTVSVIDTADLTVIETIPIGESADTITCNPDGTYVFVTNYTDNRVAVIDTRSLLVIETISVLSPRGIASSRDGSRIFVCNLTARTISVIETATWQVTMTIPVGLSPTAVTCSPDGSRIFVSNIGDNTISVISVG